MAEKIKKGFFHVLPWSVVMLMVMAMTIGIWQATEQPAQAIAPNLSTAVTADTNGDGTVDQITIVFNENMDIVDAGGAGDGLDDILLSNGCTIPNVDYTASDVPSLTLSNLTGCTFHNTSITPTVTYTTAGASTIKEHGGPTEISDQFITASDGAAPAVLSRVTADSNGDGGLDRIIFTTSENLDDDFSGLTVDVTGFSGETISTGSVANDNIFWVNFTWAGGYNTGDTPTVQITANTSLSDALSNNIAVDGAPVMTTDGAPPVMVASGFYDLDGNGTIDTIRTTWSENVIMTGSTAVDWTITGGSMNATFSSAADDAVPGTTLDVTVTADAGQTGGTVAPTIAYDNDDANNSIVDVSPAANPAGTTGPTTAEDDAAPVMLSAIYLDQNGDGTVDKIRTVWSESVSRIGAIAADLTITPGTINAAYSSWALDIITDQYLDINVTANLQVTGGAINPTVTYNDVSGAIIDASPISIGTPAGVSGPVDAVDGAAPVVLTEVYQDAGGDGSVDTAALTLSETVTFTEAQILNDFTFTANDLTGFVGNPTAAAGTGTNTITFTVSATTNLTGVSGGIEPQIAFTDDGVNHITDGTNNLASFAATSLTDNAAPIILSRVTADTNSNGHIDRIILTASEDLNDLSGGLTVSVTGYTLMFMPLTYSTCGTAFDNVFCVNLVEKVAYDTGATPTTQITANVNFGDAHGNKVVVDGVPVATTDGAAPVIVTTSPANSATGVGTSDDIVVTFSEAMDTIPMHTILSITPDPGGDTRAWSAGNTVLTVAHAAFDAAATYTFQITAAKSIAVGDPDLAAGPVPNPFTFETLGGRSGGGGGGGLPPTVTVSSPNGGESWAGNSSHNITWLSTSTIVSKVNLYYSLDRGVNFPYTIATNETNDGSYSWTVPNVPSSTVKVKIVGYDSSGTFVASDISDADFTITYTTPVPTTPSGTPSSAENPAGLSPGDLLKSPLSTTVYYYGSDNKRHIFPNEKTYKTWYANFDNVKNVSADDLRAISLGENVTVRPGTVLVKIQTDPKVYAVEPNGLLRWIPTEERVKTLYGSDWSTRVIDIPLAFWGDYTFGSDITTDVHPTGALVEYSGTTNIYYIQGAEKRLVTAAGFTANNFRSAYVLTIPAIITYATGVDITGAEETLTKIY